MLMHVPALRKAASAVLSPVCRASTGLLFSPFPALWGSWQEGWRTPRGQRGLTRLSGQQALLLCPLVGAQAHATALVKIWECWIQVSLLSCYAAVTLRHELETWIYLSSLFLLVSSSNTPWVTWACCVCSRTYLCKSKATSQMYIRYFVYKRYPGRHSQMPYHRPSKESQAAWMSHSLSGNRFAFHSKVLMGEKRESCSLCF